MQNSNQLLTDEHHKLWTVVGFIVAILALSFSLIGIYRIHLLTIVTEAQILSVDQKLEALSEKLSKSNSPVSEVKVKP
jgi:hypothetical protein